MGRVSKISRPRLAQHCPFAICRNIRGVTFHNKVTKDKEQLTICVGHVHRLNDCTFPLRVSTGGPKCTGFRPKFGCRTLLPDWPEKGMPALLAWLLRWYFFRNRHNLPKQFQASLPDVCVFVCIFVVALSRVWSFHTPVMNTPGGFRRGARSAWNDCSLNLVAPSHPLSFLAFSCLMVVSI